MTRRKFLRWLTVGTSGMVLAACAPNIATPSPQFATPGSTGVVPTSLPSATLPLPTSTLTATPCPSATATQFAPGLPWKMTGESVPELASFDETMLKFTRARNIQGGA